MVIRSIANWGSYLKTIQCQVLVSANKGGFMHKEYGNYLIYSDGRVFSKFVNKFINAYDRNGYSIYYLTIEGQVVHKLAHRLVAELFIPNEYDLPQVNHIDGNKKNNNVENLEWCTAYDTIINMLEKLD